MRHDVKSEYHRQHDAQVYKQIDTSVDQIACQEQEEERKVYDSDYEPLLHIFDQEAIVVAP